MSPGDATSRRQPESDATDSSDADPLDTARAVPPGDGRPHGSSRTRAARNTDRRVLTDGGTSDDAPTDLREFGPADFRRKADEFVTEFTDGGFDFTVDSLERLDDYAVQYIETLAERAEDLGDGGAKNVRDNLTVLWGSYFGEVLVRQFDGEWGWDEDGVAVTVPVGDGATTDVRALDAAALSFERGPQFAAVVAELQETIDADGHGPSLREQARSDAADLVEHWPSYDLDYTRAALSRLDDLVDERWSKDRFDCVELNGEGADAEIYTALVRQLGSYYGEVLVRTLDAEWVNDDGTAVDVHNDEGNTATVNVYHIAADCLEEPAKFEMTYRTTCHALDLQE